MWCSLHAPLPLYGIYPCQANYDFPPRLFLTFAPIFALFFAGFPYLTFIGQKMAEKGATFTNRYLFLFEFFLLSVALWLKKPYFLVFGKSRGGHRPVLRRKSAATDTFLPPLPSSSDFFAISSSLRAASCSCLKLPSSSSSTFAEKRKKSKKKNLFVRQTY